MAEHEDSGWELKLRFLDPTSSFAHGFQAGVVWENLRVLKVHDIYEATVSTANRPQIEMMAYPQFCLIVEARDIEHGWSVIVFQKRDPVAESKTTPISTN